MAHLILVCFVMLPVLQVDLLDFDFLMYLVLLMLLQLEVLLLGGRSGIISGHYSTIVGGFSNRVSGSNFGFNGGGS